MTWLRIAAEPVRHFTRRGDEPVPVGEARYQWILDIGQIRSSVGGENASVSVSLRNRDGECAALFATAPPLGAAASLRDASGVVFAGVVATVSLSGDGCDIGIEA